MPEKKVLKNSADKYIPRNLSKLLETEKTHPNNCCCFRGHDTDYEIRFLKTILNFPFYLYSV